jgi:hypothetical protein
VRRGDGALSLFEGRRSPLRRPQCLRVFIHVVVAGGCSSVSLLSPHCCSPLHSLSLLLSTFLSFALPLSLLLVLQLAVLSLADELG